MKISVLGCGWLGFPLAESFVSKGFSVKGSTTSVEKLPILKNANVIPFQIELNENKIIGNIDLFLENTDVLIIDIPPKLRGSSTENFVLKIRNLIPFIEDSLAKKVIFVSSTSVYQDTETTITEDTIPQPETESGKQLLEVENILLSNSKFETIIIRFGGLIGDDRHPIKMLSGKKNIKNPDAPINLIHQKDCIKIIEKILIYCDNLNNNINSIFNAVSPFHPTRKEYYTQKALELGLPLPEFENSSVKGKTISGKKLEMVLNYKFERLEL